MMLPEELTNPPNEFSVMPFWFWNDDLEAGEIIRQMDDFQKHGVEGFVIHPRVGLPSHLDWMSEGLLSFYRLAIEEADRRGMKVVLYDEGMYPSGSASGQVVAFNPGFACRCLSKVDLAIGQSPSLNPGETLVAVVERDNGERLAVIDRPANSVIRGLHYIGDGPEEEEPPAADILNPEASAAFIRLVYDKFADEFGSYFGSTIMAIFTDEPGVLGRSRERGVFPGTTDILQQVNRLLGYDFTPHLAALWYDQEPDAAHYRQDYERAISLRLEETYYRLLHNWCEAHHIALTGHPAKGDDIGPQRYFHIPGQDLVWRWVLPDHPSALEGVESTQAKCASSAMVHHQRRRNANECCGAYGHELTWDEMNWLARWAFVRGTNLLFPHAFYYSIRGVRRDERPPDVGPNSPWWQRFPEYALSCQRLSWINTDSQHVCRLAVLGRVDWLPWKAARVCYTNQYDFNYLEERQLLEHAVVDEQGIHLGGMVYRALIVEHQLSPEVSSILTHMISLGKVFVVKGEPSVPELVKWLHQQVPNEFRLLPEAPSLRIRHIIKGDLHYFMLFNEEKTQVKFQIKFLDQPNWWIYDAIKDTKTPFQIGQSLNLDGYELKILVRPKYIKG